VQQTYSLKEKSWNLLHVLLPILITQLSLTATGFFDTVMSGQASQIDLAGVAIGANIWHPVFAGLNGVLIGITPILAQLNGAGRRSEMQFVVVQGIYFAVVLAVGLIAAASFILEPVLQVMRLEEAVSNIALHFLMALSIGFLPLFISSVLRNFMDSLGYTHVTMVITLSALPINIGLNYLLIFGKLGFPQLGGVGAGYASAITYWCIALLSITAVHYLRPFKEYNIFRRFFPLSIKTWKAQLLLGVPIGFSIFCEVSIFGVVALLMTEFGTAIIAAHQAAINFASLIYMVPLSIGMAQTIVVGFEVGAKRYRDARQYSYLGIGIAIAVAFCFAVVLLLWKEQVAGLYTKDPTLLQLTQSFLAYAIFFQLSDAIAAPIQGVLRGYKDVKVTFWLAVMSYWMIGMPTGYILAKYSLFGPYGYWIGFIAGLAVGAIALFLRLIKLQRKLDIMSGS